MEIYVTTKNTGPTWSGPDPLYAKYIGTSLEEAVAVIPEVFQQQGSDTTRCQEFPDIWSAIPREMDRETIQLYMADGWWYSIVKIEVE